jgi:uncharacterized membrane protein (DUF2068 family)
MPRTPVNVKAPAEHGSSTGILLIALFKLLKGVLLITVGIGAVKLLHKDVAEVVSHWVDVLRVDPDNRFIHSTMTRLFSVTPKQLKTLSMGTFCYAALLLTEGTGLLMRKHWAEYFTVITTAALIPLEIYELAAHFSWTKIMVLLVNIAIVVYLIARLRNRRAAPEGTPAPAAVPS